LEVAKRLLFIRVESLKQEKAYVEKQLSQLYAAPNYSKGNELIPSSGFDINLLPSGSGKRDLMVESYG
jgi:hypothetical protein